MDFIKHLEQRAKELAPDYPYLQNDEYEYLWALTSSLEGTRAANKDLHKAIKFLLERSNMTPLEFVTLWEKECDMPKLTLKHLDKIVESFQKECVHSRHCKYDQCKYGEEDYCPVYLGYKKPICDVTENKPSKEEFEKRRSNCEEDRFS